MKRTVVIITLCLVVGCASYPFIFQDKGTLGATSTDVTIDVPNQSDILFVLDNSGSMAPKIAKLKAQVGEFVQALSSTPNQFRIGITTTDQQDTVATDNCNNPPNPTAGADTTYNGVCGHLMAPAGKAPYLDRSDFSGPTGPSDLANTITNAAHTGYADLLNPNGSSWEQPMKAAFNALDPNNVAASGPNFGFFRPGALLVILILTDETDCSYEIGDGQTFVDSSPGGVVAGDLCYSKADKLVSATDWAKRIVARHGGDPRLVAVGVISGSYNDPAGNLLTGPCARQPDGSDPTLPVSPTCFGFNGDPFFNQYTPNGKVGDVSCDAVANSRLFDFSGQFKNLHDSICRSDYSQALLRLADLSNQQCFALNQAPLNGDASNIQIKLRRNGESDFAVVPQADDNGWSYDNNPAPEVCLHGTAKRQQGDTVRLFVLDTASGDTSQPAAR